MKAEYQLEKQLVQAGLKLSYLHLTVLLVADLVADRCGLSQDKLGLPAILADPAVVIQLLCRQDVIHRALGFERLAMLVTALVMQGRQ